MLRAPDRRGPKRELPLGAQPRNRYNITKPQPRNGASAAYLQIVAPYHLYSYSTRKFIIMGQVYLAPEGSPCIGHNLKVSIDVRPSGSDVWETRGTRDYGYNPIGSDDLGLRLRSWFIDRECGTGYRSRYVLDDSITVVESSSYRYC